MSGDSPRASESPFVRYLSDVSSLPASPPPPSEGRAPASSCLSFLISPHPEELAVRVPELRELNVAILSANPCVGSSQHVLSTRRVLFPFHPQNLRTGCYLPDLQARKEARGLGASLTSHRVPQPLGRQSQLPCLAQDAYRTRRRSPPPDHSLGGRGPTPTLEREGPCAGRREGHTDAPWRVGPGTRRQASLVEAL